MKRLDKKILLLEADEEIEKIHHNIALEKKEKDIRQKLDSIKEKMQKIRAERDQKELENLLSDFKSSAEEQQKKINIAKDSGEDIEKLRKNAEIDKSKASSIDLEKLRTLSNRDRVIYMLERNLKRKLRPDTDLWDKFVIGSLSWGDSFNIVYDKEQDNWYEIKTGLVIPKEDYEYWGIETSTKSFLKTLLKYLAISP